ncbi:RNA polymerase factor sigma-54 [Camelimonas abortus]|uniref:RNA polymerase sigma-54 factor n=1 Tax=Camelimonas abortus TaxID=1017184 RepID=A0ABV7LDH4_9HYPH
MSLSARISMRQAQSLALTPQLLQAIRLLQMSSLELSAWVAEELERNPFLEAGADGEGGDSAPAPAPDAADARPWDAGELETSQEALERALDAPLDNVFDPDSPGVTPHEAPEPAGDSAVWSGAAGPPAGDLDALELAAEQPDLREHLRRQLGLTRLDAATRAAALALVDSITPAGYLDPETARELDALAARLGVSRATVDAALAAVQQLDPPGVGARDLAECLAIQLRQQDRLDAPMQALLSRLDLVAKRDMAKLRRLCGVDEATLTAMLREIRALEPLPGRPFDAAPATPLVPDVIVRRGPDGRWRAELNAELLPRVRLNHAWRARAARAARSPAESSFIASAWRDACWLDRSLEQRARTILLVAGEIVRRQEGFFGRGVSALRPLTLKEVADAIGMHESTVSRVTMNKSIGCERGVYGMKFFFPAAISAAGDGAAHSAEAVRHRIRQLIEAEKPDAVLSDDVIVRLLREDGVEIARRTVAKYRESLRIPSSVDRRRMKAAARTDGLVA